MNEGGDHDVNINNNSINNGDDDDDDDDDVNCLT